MKPNGNVPMDIYEKLMNITAEDITRTFLIELFSKKVVRSEDKTKPVEVEDAPVRVTDRIIVPAGTLSNVLEDTETTVGRYLFNVLLISDIFEDIIPYINEPQRGLGSLGDRLAKLILMGKIETTDFHEFMVRGLWIGYFSELFVPGKSLSMMQPIPEVLAERDRLIAAHPEIIEAQDHVAFAEVIEKPLIEMAKEYLRKDPSWAIYGYGKKPDIGNQYKNMNIVVGGILDPTTNKYGICTKCLQEGIPQEDMHLFANQLIISSYNRGVSTQIGGALTKSIYNAFQHVVTVAGTDCGTDATLPIDFSEDLSNIVNFTGKFVKKGSGYVELTEDNMASFYGKRMQMRSPKLCGADGYICNKCLGNLLTDIGYKNIGLTIIRLSNDIVNSSLKSMHDLTIKTTVVDPMAWFKFE